MSDWLQFLVDERITPEDAELHARQVRERLVTDGWIAPKADEKCALGGKGHRPGRDASSLYSGRGGERDFAKHLTNGVVIDTAPFTNLAAGPYQTDLLICPTCETAIDTDLLMECVGSWMSGDAGAKVHCDGCDEDLALRSLRCTDAGESPVVCGNLTLTFYNWPPLDSPSWQRSVIDVVADVLGARPSLAYAKL